MPKDIAHESNSKYESANANLIVQPFKASYNSHNYTWKCLSAVTNAFPQQKHLFRESGVHFLKSFLIFCPLRKCNFKVSIHQKQKSHRPALK